MRIRVIVQRMMYAALLVLAVVGYSASAQTTMNTTYVAQIAGGQHLAGSHTYSFDAGNLASGLYVYKLRFGRTILVREMIITK